MRRKRRNKIKPGKDLRVKLRHRLEGEANHGFMPVAVAFVRQEKDPDDPEKTVTKGKVVSLLKAEHNAALGDLLAEAAMNLG